MSLPIQKSSYLVSETLQGISIEQSSTVPYTLWSTYPSVRATPWVLRLADAGSAHRGTAVYEFRTRI
jgi:hypothetical protein